MKNGCLSRLFLTNLFLFISVPDVGPTLGHMAHSSRVITVKVIRFDLKNRNGDILSYSCLTKPGNTTKEIIATKKTLFKPFSFNGLLPFTLYRISCKARTSAGYGISGPTLTVTTSEEAPGEPKTVDTLPVKDTPNLQLRWTPPDPLNGNITKYDIQIVLVNKTKVLCGNALANSTVQ